jgi:hypothetical protein
MEAGRIAMRKRVSKGGLTADAIAGSYVPVLGLNVGDAKRKGLCSCSIARTDRTLSRASARHRIKGGSAQIN